MRLHALNLAILISVVLSGCGPEKEKRVLLFADRSSDSQTSSVALTSVDSYLRKNNLKTDTTSNTAYFNQDSLSHYGAVVLLNLGTDPLEVREQNEIERFVQAGGGIAVIHSQPATRYQWQWLNATAAIDVSPEKNQQPGPIEFTVTDDGNAATETISPKWTMTDKLVTARATKDAAVLVATTSSDPVSWINERGGKTFVTLAGGTAEAYSNEDFLKHIYGGVQYVLKGKALDFGKATTPRVPEENRFLELVLDTYLDEPIEMEILSDGRVLFIERHGRLKLYDPSKKETRVIGTLPVQLEGNYEDGLLGLELDPRFDTNNFIYLYYSPLGGDPVQRLSRFSIKGDSLVKSSEKVVLTVPVQRETCCHSAGNVYFGPDGYLYLSTGDNTSSKESDGFTPIDERPGRGPFDAQKSSANTHDLRGKILRIHVEEDGSYTVPDGNLFPKDGSQGKPEIYIMGARNPYRLTVDKRGFVYWGDVGPDGGEDSDRGPRSYDEFNQARKPGYYGWPYFVADNKAYADFDFATNTIGARFDPANVLNESPNNTGSRKLPPAQPAMIYYPYNRSAEFPMLGTGSRSAMAGPFYYFGDYKSNVQLPAYYDNKLLIFEWGRNWIKAVSFNKEGDLIQIEPFLPSISFWHPIDVKFGKDGALYVLQYGSNYFARNPDAQLVRIEYAEGNRQPVAKIVADKTAGAVPLTVKLSARSSFDYDKNARLSYSWASSAGTTAEGEEATFTFDKEGTFTVTLTVKDEAGSTSKTELAIKAGNETPVVTVDFPQNSSFYFDNETLNYQVAASDKEDGTVGKGIDAKQVRFSIDYIKEGKDLALMNSLSSASVNAKYIKGKTLMDGSDCRSCHSMDKASVGPSWIQVAERYKGKPQSIPALVEKVIKGGNGNWGHAMMAAHPQLSESDTRQMIEYILSISEESGGLPLKGTYALKDHAANGEAGIYVISASYTDKGHPVTGELTGRETIILRNPKIQAEDFDVFNNVGQQRPVGGDLAYVSEIRDGSWIGFRDIDLKGITSITVNAQANNGRIEVRSGTPDGDVVATIDLKGTAKDWPFPWRTLSAKINSQDRKGDLYFVFRNEEAKGRSFAGLDWILFKR